MLDSRTRSDLSGAFKRSRMLADEVDTMVGTRVSHFVNKLTHGKAFTAHAHMPVVEHNRGHNRRVLPAMLA